MTYTFMWHRGESMSTNTYDTQILLLTTPLEYLCKDKINEELAMGIMH